MAQCSGLVRKRMVQFTGMVPTECCNLYLVTSSGQADNRLICLTDGHRGNRKVTLSTA
ncbi:hypothetical protein DPMN_144120 [Dreissena polymorpha]|uniref:Uncharacterized protein n=1 Tax=Dreissena polymorpha TaxID=45954 RepID=A0A9D4GEU5_DREPO|nr:hypothetical protein DPMN_144120 [Dreissena polymorpha]